MSVFVGILAIFKPSVGKKYWGMFKKGWGCIGKRVTFQKCDTNFKEDIKNSVLRKVVLKKPKMVKPVSFAIEVVAILIVLLTVFSLAEVAKGGLAMIVFGTCTVQQPDACVLGGVDVCPVGGERLNWFQEWGVVLSALPGRLRTWDEASHLPTNPQFYHAFNEELPVALYVFDPGCDMCLQSFRSKLESGFFESYNVAMLPFATEAETREIRFQNSDILVRYMIALGEVPLGGLSERDVTAAWRLTYMLFMEFSPEHVIWQSAMQAMDTTPDDVHEIVGEWLVKWGYTELEAARIRALVDESEVVDARIAEIRNIVMDDIRVIGVPTTIFDGRKRAGVF